MQSKILTRIVHFSHMIRLSHTIFALPFALAALVLIIRNDIAEIDWLNIVYIVLAFTGMRSFAMAYNRLVDADIDSENLRTTNREIPAGKLSRNAVIIFGLISFIIMAVCAYLLDPLAFFLSFPAAAIVAGYSHAKRFTWLCHLWLGVAIGMAVPAVYLALTQTIPVTSILMMGILATYIAGFDILYSLQDMHFDRAKGLYSVPARFGASSALMISAGLHFLTVSGLVLLWKIEELSFTYLAGAAIAAFVISEEHRVIGWGPRLQMDKIPAAFFNYNAVFSVLFFLIILLDWLLPLG